MQTLTPATHDLGDYKVRGTLPAKTRTMVGPLILVDSFGPTKQDYSARRFPLVPGNEEEYIAYPAVPSTMSCP